MALRTPGLQEISQFHSYWGRYAYTVGAGVWANGSNLLPGAPGNPLSAAEFAKIQTGDIASTTDASVAADRGLFVCVDTPTAATVEWRRLDSGASVTQTIRDAHVIVVAQEGVGWNPTTGVPVTDTLLDLNPQVAGIAADFIDPGDGTGLSAALTAALALSGSGTTSDVRLRPCNINLSLGAVLGPLAVPTSTRLLGSADNESTVRGRFGNGEDQRIFTCAAGASVERISMISPAPAAGAVPINAGGIVDVGDVGVKVVDCRIEMGISIADARTTLVCIDSTSVTGSRLNIIGCRFVGTGGSHADSFTGDSVAIRTQGSTTTSQTGAIIRGCAVDGFDSGIQIGASSGLFGDVAVSQVTMVGMFRAGIAVSAAGAVGHAVRCTDIRVAFSVSIVTGQPQTAFEVNVTATGGRLSQMSIVASTVAFNISGLAANRNFIRIVGEQVSDGATGIKLVGCGIEDLGAGASTSATDAIVLSTATPDDDIRGGDILCDWTYLSGAAVSVLGGAPVWEHAHQV